MILMVIFISMLIAGIIFCIIASRIKRFKKRNEVEYAGLIFIIFGGLLSFLGIIMFIYTQGNIDVSINAKANQAEEIIQDYKKADSKRLLTARRASVAVYNENVRSYKSLSENPWVSVWFPKEVADSLTEIDMGELEE